MRFILTRYLIKAMTKPVIKQVTMDDHKLLSI